MTVHVFLPFIRSCDLFARYAALHLAHSKQLPASNVRRPIDGNNTNPSNHLQTHRNSSLTSSHTSLTMSWLPKKFPTPVAGPMAPFYAAGLIIMYGVNSAANAMMNSAEFKNDPRNPHLKDKPAAAGH
ncbi:hypothetical protein M430DRAFT_44446 [Amorphotheca resinae ATCC 22711]|uniref:Mitochondrial F1F0 ATP synthase subunit Atp18 n=1 Tax=Amorphotheca resinae ATCC 22711 TaxID=857342 RepID=A0A2T3AV87_AMORE|nr:hypothetical protein M430DRAFT_44446 [Amorphotheca resinae ATCC 22711]PSS12543.1 hypothetical protein M430DRAFT_44446 [Amorphotheca resinae ATCC 22711]